MHSGIINLLKREGGTLETCSRSFGNYNTDMVHCIAFMLQDRRLYVVLFFVVVVFLLGEMSKLSFSRDDKGGSFEMSHEIVRPRSTQRLEEFHDPRRASLPTQHTQYYVDTAVKHLVTSN